MSKPRATMYVRYGDLIVSATSTSDAPDALDDLRVEVGRAFEHAYTFVDLEIAPDDMPVADPGTVDTTQLPPVD